MYYIDGDPFTFCNMAIVILGLAGTVVVKNVVPP